MAPTFSRRRFVYFSSIAAAFISGLGLYPVVRRGRRLLAEDPPEDPRVFVFQYFPAGSRGAEIGVWKGEFSAKILESVKPSKFHLIDPWRYETGDQYEKSWYGGDDSDGQKEMDAVYEECRTRLAPAIEDGIAVIHRKASSEASGDFPDEYFDWVYIDGNHFYEFVKEDLELYYPKIKPGGVIVGDDFVAEGWWKDGVIRAVVEFVAAAPVELVEVRNRQFVLRKNA